MSMFTRSDFVPWTSLESVLDFWITRFLILLVFLDLKTAPVLGVGPTTVSKLALSSFRLDEG